MKIKVLGQGSRYEAVLESIVKAGHELSNEPDLLVLANYPKILKKEEYEHIKYGAINCHGGLLPQYRGSSVLNWQLINGETEGWVSVIQVNEGIDTGDMWATTRYKIEDNDTIADIREKSNREFVYIFSVLKLIDTISEKKYKPCRQYDKNICYWHHRKPEDSRILWDRMTAEQVHNLVRASEPPYEAFCFHIMRGFWVESPYKARVVINKSKLLDETFKGIAGRVVRKIDDGVVVICQDRGIWIQADLKVGDQLF
jgi:methionyl-tRNA formyltransferase